MNKEEAKIARYEARIRALSRPEIDLLEEISCDRVRKVNGKWHHQPALWAAMVPFTEADLRMLGKLSGLIEIDYSHGDAEARLNDLAECALWRLRGEGVFDPKITTDKGRIPAEWELALIGECRICTPPGTDESHQGMSGSVLRQLWQRITRLLHVGFTVD